MTSPTFVVRELERFPSSGKGDKLEFCPGLNTLVGRPNTGKSKWLRMLDFVLGSAKQPAEALDDQVAEKYEAARVLAEVNGEEICIERRWNESGLKTKVIVDENPMDRNEFSNYLLDKLSIPLIHYPQGNPLGARTWPELGWRSLLRHMYRRQNRWSDLADQQPDSEQHACVLQFLGLAEHVFSSQFTELADKTKELSRLRVEKDQFMALLAEVSSEILEEPGLTVAMTPDSIQLAALRIMVDIKTLRSRREQLLEAVRDSALDETSDHQSFDQANEALSNLVTEREQLKTRFRQLSEHVLELDRYRESIEEEGARLDRALAAGHVLSGLKVTHCPSCDRALEVKDNGPDCHLCCRPLEDGRVEAEGRLGFEREQLSVEAVEVAELLGSHRKEIESITASLRDTKCMRDRIRIDLRPLQQRAASILPPDIAIIDVNIGRFEERLSQLSRISATLERRVEIANKIKKAERRVAELEKEVEQAKGGLGFEDSSDLLEDGMNDYLNLLNTFRPNAWTQKIISLRIDERKLSLKVGRGNWQAVLGGTLSIYLLLAYHYGLMQQVVHEGCHFPGLVVLDFPAELDDGSKMDDVENFVLEPFVSLMRRPGFESCQVIAAGRSFANLEGANRIVLNDVWA